VREVSAQVGGFDAWQINGPLFLQSRVSRGIKE
jgi:hypothetical protein